MTTAIMRQTQDRRPVCIDGYTAAVLAGGQSRCFGRDKSLALLKGKPLLEHVLESLQHLFDGVSPIVQDPASYAWQDLDALADVLPGTEALGGLLTALLDAPGEHCFVVACDMPFLHIPPWSERSCRCGLPATWWCRCGRENPSRFTRDTPADAFPPSSARSPEDGSASSISIRRLW